ncbi:MAG: ATP-binding protein [Candidatus Krumholzibacteriia bacterium]
MKIAFIGTHGVGKTTLCYELAAALKRLDLGVDLVKEVARGCPLPINRETTDAAQNWILHTQVAREIELAAAYDVIVCDRAVLDNYAYMVHAAGRRPELEPFIRHWMATYSLLVKVPVIAPPAFDGTRDTSVEFQAGIDRIIDQLLHELALPRLELPTAGRDGWVALVLQALDLPATPPQLDLFGPAKNEKNNPLDGTKENT